MTKSKQKKRIGILTGGGDCPGLNAAIRAVVKSADIENIDVYGIEEGFWGLCQNHVKKINMKQVSGILPKGGTILRSSRFNPFKEKKILATCLANFKKYRFDGLIVIGGDGSLGIASDLWKKEGVPIVGIPKTIDNDIYGTERTIGFYTAIQTAMEAIDKLHTTAESHNFIMVLELMGRHCGYLATYAGIAGGADYILVPEIKTSVTKLVRTIKDRHRRGKNFSIVVVAEDAKLYDDKGNVIAETKTIRDDYGKIKLGGIGDMVKDILQKKTGYETRYTNLGYVQRGGSPNVMDRLFATFLGCAAVDLVVKNRWGYLLAGEHGKIVPKPLSVVHTGIKKLPRRDYERASRFFR